MSTAPSDPSRADEPRFRDALRSVPGRAWIVSLGILVNRVGNLLPEFVQVQLAPPQATPRVQRQVDAVALRHRPASHRSGRRGLVGGLMACSMVG